jgi:hypothetical protein
MSAPAETLKLTTISPGAVCAHGSTMLSPLMVVVEFVVTLI